MHTKLEKRKEKLLLELARNEIQRPDISREHLEFWLYSFKNGSIEDSGFTLRLIETFIHSIYLYGDYALIAYQFSDNKDIDKLVETDIAQIEKNHEFRQILDSAIHG